MSLALSVNGDTLVVGANADNSNATGVNGDQSNLLAPNSGAAYVFRFDRTSWAQTAYVKPSDTAPDRRFANTVSVSADGAMFVAESTRATATDTAPAVYVFLETGGAWSQVTELFIPQITEGSSIALSGDEHTLAIGAGAVTDSARVFTLVDR